MLFLGNARGLWDFSSILSIKSITAISMQLSISANIMKAKIFNKLSLDLLPFFWIAVPKSFGKWIAGNFQLCNLKIKGVLYVIIFNLISISEIWCVHMKSTEILFVWENCFVCLLLMIQNVNRKVWMAGKSHRFSMNVPPYNVWKSMKKSHFLQHCEIIFEFSRQKSTSKSNL